MASKQPSKDHIVVDIPEQPPPAWLKDYNDQFFHQVLQDAGRWAFGVIFVEVWVLNDLRTHMFRPENGWWIEPYAQESKFDPLCDPTSLEYLEPTPLAPGVGLPGCLWAECQNGNGLNHHRHTRHSSVLPSVSEGFDHAGVHRDVLQRHVNWREVKPLAEDPDQPFNPRLKYLAECGLGLAAGVPFRIGPTEGLVVYMARESADEQKLTNSVNEEYLTHATLMIGSAYSLRLPRRAVVKARKAECSDGWKRLKRGLQTFLATKMTLQEFVEKQSQRPSDVSKLGSLPENTGGGDNVCSSFIHSVIGKTRLTTRKCLGANVKAPPTFTWDQTAWTFVGAFITLAILTNINKALETKYGASHSIVMGPFGALMTLQYGLTAAPASQPRNALIGQTLGLLIAHGVGQADGLELWLKQTLATSLAIAAMVKCGATHPPAGAAALLFSNGSRSWQNLGMMLMGNVVAIVCAAIINNANERRQYPTFWGIKPIIDLYRGDDPDKKAKQA